jgi:hypothetical protein
MTKEDFFNLQPGDFICHKEHMNWGIVIDWVSARTLHIYWDYVSHTEKERNSFDSFSAGGLKNYLIAHNEQEVLAIKLKYS